MTTRKTNARDELFAIMADRRRNLEALVEKGAISITDPRDLHRSNDDLVVGTAFQNETVQRDGVRYTRPTSRKSLLAALKS